jgi:hypothetical protein
MTMPSLRSTLARTLPVLALVLLAALSGCKKDTDKATAAPVVLTAPTTADDVAWKTYLQQVIAANREGVTDQVYPYYLPAGSDVAAEDGSSPYGRQLENVSGVVARTVLPGNMLVFGSPDSAKMADLVVAAFTGAKPDALKGSRVLFIGKAADSDRVKAAVEAAGAQYKFVEAK